MKFFLTSLAALFFSLKALAEPYGLDSIERAGPFLDGRLPEAIPATGPDGFVVVPAFRQLKFDDPVLLTVAPGSDRLYVCGRRGLIYSFTNDPNVSRYEIFLDIRNRTEARGDSGLLGLAFHPDFGKANSPNRGYFYVYYQFSDDPHGPDNSLEKPSYNRLSRFTVPDGSAVADPDSEVILINQFDPHVWHNGGGLFFDDAGFLYVSNGDGGGSNDQYNNSQRLNGGFFGGVFRIDVDCNPARSHPIRRQPQSLSSSQPSFSTNYFIPNDNPFLDPNSGILEEFWAIGLRNSYRMSFDAVTRRIWAGDVGQEQAEEINLLVKGGNYQWSFREAVVNGPKAKPAHITGIEQPPIYSYTREHGDQCVIGGYVYRGNEHPSLRGKYIFGDNISGRIWSLEYSASNPPLVTYLCSMPSGASGYVGLAGFGVDQNQELYLCRLGDDGQIYKLSRITNAPTPPLHLSEIGVFTNLATLAPNPGLLPYDVNSPLWSDGASKQRWIALPSGKQISFAATNEWEFPDGTVFVKHFELPVDENNPTLVRRLETRFLVRDIRGGVYGLTYRWWIDNSDADLLTNSLDETISIQTSSGVRTQTWHYPSQQECLICHNINAAHVLAVKTHQLNGQFLFPQTSQTDNQLRVWNHLGFFNTNIDEANITNFLHSARIDDSAETLELRARSYLDANCAQCHRPKGAPASFDARLATPLTAQRLINGAVSNPLGLAGSRLLIPQNVDLSMIPFRTHRLGNSQMPPLARNVVDQHAIALLESWINRMAPASFSPQHDLNDDGADDLLLRNSEGHFAIQFMQQTNLAGFARLNLTSSEWQLVGAADFNHNRKTDLLWQRTNGQLAVWFMDGTNFLSASSLRNGIPVSREWRLAALADLNSNGSADLIWQHDHGRIAIWLMDGTQVLQSTLLRNGQPAASGWKLVAAGDVNGDTDIDLLWQHSSGRIAVWYMDGLSFLGASLLRDSMTISPGWRLAGINDFDGDQSGDLLWENSDGRKAIWWMHRQNFQRVSLLNFSTSFQNVWRFIGVP